MKAMLTVLLLLAPTTTLATPIAYLDCQIPTGEGPRVAKIAMDQDRKEVVYQLPSENLTKFVPAVFTDKTVTFAVADPAGENTFSIDRANLSVERQRRVGIEKPAIIRGSCSVTVGP